MSAMAAAAGWQTRILARSKDWDEGPNPKEQRKEDGQRTPHPHMMP